MATSTGMRYVGEALLAYGVTHVFFVPQMLLPMLTGTEGRNGVRPLPRISTPMPCRCGRSACAAR
jgi:hypothetical protein